MGNEGLGFQGTRFTLCDQREGDYKVQERIDRWVANVAWTNMFMESFMQHSSAPTSNHKPTVFRYQRTEPDEKEITISVQV